MAKTKTACASPGSRKSVGIRALAVHGRTRDMLYTGEAEYDTIAAIKQAVTIPVIANGDVDSPRKAREVLRKTGADALMIGRAAQGRPWIFHEIAHYLASGSVLRPPSLEEIRGILLEHVRALHEFYGETAGVRIARKHLSWYAKDRPENAAFRDVVNRAESAAEQLRFAGDYFEALRDADLRGARGGRVGPAERLIALVHERDVAARGKGHGPFARGLVGHRHGLAERRNAPTLLAVHDPVAHVVDGRDAVPIIVEHGFDEQEVGIDVGFTGVQRREHPDIASLHCSFLGFTRRLRL